MCDPDVWMREGIKDDGSQRWEYVLLYVGDCLYISANTEYVLRNEIGKCFKLKEASIGPPDIYLGGKMRQVELNNDAKAWSFSSSQYVQSAVKNVEACLREKPCKFPTGKVEAPFTSEYLPEIDFTRELDVIEYA